MKKTLTMSFRPKWRNLLGIKSKLHIKKKTYVICVSIITLNFQLITHNSFSQNVGINADGSNPQSNTMLDIKGTDNSSSSFGLKVKNSAGTDQFVVRNDGNVGVGTSAPGAKLSVYSTAGNFDNLMSFQSGVGTRWDAGVFNAGGNALIFEENGNNNLVLQKTSGNVGIGTDSPTTLLDVARVNNTQNGLRIRAGDNSIASGGGSQMLFSFNGGTSYTHAIKTRHHAAQDDGNAIDFFVWDFGTDADADIGTNHVMSLNAGKVGIGTDSPQVDLEIASSTGGELMLNSSSATPVFSMRDNAGTLQEWAFHVNNASNTFQSATSSSNSLFLSTRSSFVRDGNHTSVMAFTSGGDVGIGTTTPSTKLEVQDNVPFIQITDANDGTANVGARSYLSFNANDGSLGFIGDGASGNNDIHLYSNNNLRLNTGGSSTIRLFVDAAGNVGVGSATVFGTGAQGVLAISNGTAPSTSMNNGVQLYAQDVSSSSELRVRDEAGNVTTLSPHNFSIIPEGKSEELAWAFYSERDGKSINVDMAKMARVVEKLSAENLVYIKDNKTGEISTKDLQEQVSQEQLLQKVDKLEKQNVLYRSELDELKQEIVNLKEYENKTHSKSKRARRNR